MTTREELLTTAENTYRAALDVQENARLNLMIAEEALSEARLDLADAHKAFVNAYKTVVGLAEVIKKIEQMEETT